MLDHEEHFPTASFWKKYQNIEDLPKRGYDSVEIEAVSEGLDANDKRQRLIFSPDDGCMSMCCVFLRKKGSQALCIGCFNVKRDAFSYAHFVCKALNLMLRGNGLALKVFMVPNIGYVAARGNSSRFTDLPEKAALYHASIARDDFLDPELAVRGKWIVWSEAKRIVLDRMTDRIDLLTRVLRSTIKEMGDSAPQKGCAGYYALQTMLRAAIELNRADSDFIFSDTELQLILLQWDRFRAIEPERKFGRRQPKLL